MTVVTLLTSCLPQCVGFGVSLDGEWVGQRAVCASQSCPIYLEGTRKRKVGDTPG
jgi:hypothetical protein